LASIIPTVEQVQQRRSERISLAIPVEVSGMDITGKNFVEATKTESISRYGARVRLISSLVPEQELSLRRTGNGHDLDARVVRLIEQNARGRAYAIELIHCPDTVWGVHFPPDSAAGTMCAVLLHCSSCPHHELVRVNTFEMAAFEDSGGMPRTCSRCGRLTHWKAVSGNLQIEVPVGPSARWTENRRKQNRVKMKVSASLRQPPPTGDDAVKVVDVSRGGVRFLSSRIYLVNTIVQAAVPYTASAENLFIPARIIWRRTEHAIREYGLAYIRPMQPQNK
jgi:hypothetical protein